MPEPIFCAACKVVTTRALANEHHVVPQAAGGSAGPTEFLCADCHGACHRLAEKIRSARVPEILDDIRIRWPDVATQRRLMQLAEVVAAELDRPALSPSGEVRVSFSLPRIVADHLRIFASSLRDPESNRKLGMSGYLRRLILGHVEARSRGGF